MAAAGLFVVVNASAAIVVYRPPAATCLGAKAGTLNLGMALNESWKKSSAVKGRILVTTATGRPVSSRVGSFASGSVTLNYAARTPGRFRISYAWFIPADYLAKQPLRPGARAYYRVGQWQVAATFETRVRACG